MRSRDGDPNPIGLARVSRCREPHNLVKEQKEETDFFFLNVVHNKFTKIMFTICHVVTKGVEFFRTTILKMEDQQLFVLFIFIFDILEPRFKFQFILLCLNIDLLFSFYR